MTEHREELNCSCHYEHQHEEQHHEHMHHRHEDHCCHEHGDADTHVTEKDFTKLSPEAKDEVAQEVFGGPSLYVRDVNLPDCCLKEYLPGRIIMERGFTDASCRIGGLFKRHRFMIISTHMMNMQPFEHGTNWGLFIANRNAHFKVLDVIKEGKKTGIILLHLPDDKRWQAFIDTFDEELEHHALALAAERFRESLKEEIIPELRTNAWSKRCMAPLGMLEDGQLFDLYPSLSIELQLMEKVDAGCFRKIAGECVYMERSEKLAECLPEKCFYKDATGIIGYGFVHAEYGLCLLVLRQARVQGETLQIQKLKNEEMPYFQLRSLEGEKFLPLKRLQNVEIEVDAELLKAVGAAEDEELQALRQARVLDACRNPWYPDEIEVVLLKQGLEPESVWVRGTGRNAEAAYGILETEPQGDFDVHLDDRIYFLPVYPEDNSEEIVCAAILDTELLNESGDEA